MSIRDNENRFGGPLAPDESPPTQDLVQEKQSMSFVVATEIVDLPSKGQFYPQGSPLHGVESLEIRHMTAKDEDILVNKSYITKGVVLDRLLQSVLVDKTVSVDDLLVGDKNALLVAARITGYGPEYNTKVLCPACGSISENAFDLDEVSSTQANTDLYKASQTANGTFLLTLPNSGVEIQIRPFTGRDEKNIINSNKMRKKNKLPELGLTDQMKKYIVSVNGSENKKDISDFVDVMPALDSRYLRGAYKEVIPNVDLAQHFECPECGHEQEMEVPFNTDFFWPK
tara:strand:- start:3948 stop:4802 length:855 start_codon:yes stop_codon:yes gene_type:complete